MASVWSGVSGSRLRGPGDGLGCGEVGGAISDEDGRWLR